MSVNPAVTAQAAADGDAAQSDALRRGLQTLAGLLAESDMAATDCFAEIALAPGCAGWRPLLEPLAAPMAALDFAAALAICRTILARLDQPAAKAHAPEGMPR